MKILSDKRLTEILPVSSDVLARRCVPFVMPQGEPIIYDNHDHRPVAYEEFPKGLRGYFWCAVEKRRLNSTTDGWADVLTRGAFVHAQTGTSYLFGERQAPLVVPELQRCGYVEILEGAPHIPGTGDEWPIDDELLERLKKTEDYPVPAEECDEE